MYYNRITQENIRAALKNNLAVAITGPRQSGKSTLAKHIIKSLENVQYLDLENPSDLEKLENPQLYFTSHRDKMFCIDEIQRKPDLFPLLRWFIDDCGRNGMFLFLGSASRDLLRQSSETLAGRIIYKQLTPFLLEELPTEISIYDYFIQGGFPRSILTDIKNSIDWRRDFIFTFLEKDLLQWQNFTPALMRRIWTMLAHNNGQTINFSTFSNSLTITDKTVKNYIDLLESTFMVHAVQPYHSNLGKRLVKAPKVYISDSGIITSLLQIHSFSDLMSHSVFGSVWETIVLSNLKGHFPYAEFYFYRTSHGAEIDFVMKYERKIYVIECKASESPKLQKGNFNAIEDIQPDYTFVVAPVENGWQSHEKIEVVSLKELVKRLKIRRLED